LIVTTTAFPLAIISKTGMKLIFEAQSYKKLIALSLHFMPLQII